jgi:hypothetical protein
VFAFCQFNTNDCDEVIRKSSETIGFFDEWAKKQPKQEDKADGILPHKKHQIQAIWQVVR